MINSLSNYSNYFKLDPTTLTTGLLMKPDKALQGTILSALLWRLYVGNILGILGSCGGEFMGESGGGIRGECVGKHSKHYKVSISIRKAHFSFLQYISLDLTQERLHNKTHEQGLISSCKVLKV